MNPVIRACAWFLVVAWLALTIYMLVGPGIWWGPLVCLVWAGPALLYVWPAGKRNDTRRDHIVFRSTLPDDPPDPGEDKEPEPFGRPALEVVRDALVTRGSTVGPVLHSRFYAWTIDVGACEVLVQGDGDELLVIAAGRRFETVVAAIVDILRADSRFSDIEVLTARGFDERERLPRATARRT